MAGDAQHTEAPAARATGAGSRPGERVRIGLMGFGRVGRSLLRVLRGHPRLEVVAIADPGEAEALEYLLRFDTLLGRFPEEIGRTEDHLVVGGRPIAFLTGRPGTESDPDWRELGVDCVVEATGRPGVGRSELEGHLARGAARVVLCVPPAEPPDRTVLMGVNDDALRASDRIVSNGSCTAHAAAPILAMLDEAFGVERVFLNSVHAYTNEQRLADVPAEEPRRGRAASENIIPQQAGTAAVLEAALPDLAGKVIASAMNVPVPNGSVVDMVCWHREPVSVELINEVVRTAASTERWKRTVAYQSEPIVSSDVLRSPCSSTFDAEATMAMDGRISKTLAWFDNGWGYVHRAVELIERLAALDAEEAAR
ncbi:MAG: type I glyceraldehyde-3-phosphate dehydrogenase [Acidobacteria bacterium]|nr:MAG: type I glyceraldehyde-3-phosphate dehydrogenase [Acidobacteriota bacterium]